jgi:type IV pilus assembly protein PilC
MPIFEYRSKNNLGQTVVGAVEAPSVKVATETLIDRGLTVLSIVEQPKETALTFSVEAMLPVRTKDLVIFSRQLAVMASANLPIVQSLRILVRQTPSVKLRSIISEVADEVDGGAKLSQAMERFPKVFSKFFVSMVRSGETSGRLDEVLNYLADQQEKDYDLMSRIRGAMIYPAFIVLGLFGVGFFMMIFVVPKLTDILKETGQSLPITTQILIAVSEFLAGYWYLIFIGLAGLIIFIKFYTRAGSGRRQWDYLKIKLPVMGKLMQRIYIVRFTQSLGTLLAGGVPLTRSLEIVSNVVGNSMYEEIIAKTKKEVEDGNPLAKLFLESNVFPLMTSHMISVGEQTGRLEVILGKLTDFYIREIDNLVSNLVALIEPLVMILLGLAVGVMVSAVILPMYNLAGSF